MNNSGLSDRQFAEQNFSNFSGDDTDKKKKWYMNPTGYTLMVFFLLFIIYIIQEMRHKRREG